MDRRPAGRQTGGMATQGATAQRVIDLTLLRDQVGEAFDSAAEVNAPVEVLDALMSVIRDLSRQIADTAG